LWGHNRGHKEKRLAFGVYPVVSIATAREKLRLAKAELSEGNDSGKVKKTKNFKANFNQ
jgi:hypothetical protein